MIFFKPYEFSRKIIQEPLNKLKKLEKDDDQESPYEESIYVRRVSISNPTQTLHAAYATVSKHKKVLFKHNKSSWNAAYPENSPSPTNFSTQDYKPSFYPNASLNPELERKIKAIGAVNRTSNLFRKEKCFSSPRYQRNVRKGSPIKIHSISPNIAISLMRTQINEKCSQCGYENCTCFSKLDILNQKIKEQHHHNKNARKALQNEINELVISKENQKIKKLKPMLIKTYRAQSVDTQLLSIEDIEQKRNATLSVCVTPVTLHKKRKYKF
ncbi:unnamed protein product [Blepharisma stoltei]|uniref:Uncharacterized protein n=1 Tax=Blepharisma stoltei TaxID=1481888 RepID=A0AAU9IU83_9CILI|nr:unnamed protein product [Blepharisma stoltei]